MNVHVPDGGWRGMIHMGYILLKSTGSGKMLLDETKSILTSLLPHAHLTASCGSGGPSDCWVLATFTACSSFSTNQANFQCLLLHMYIDHIIQMCSGITHGRVLNGEIHAQRFQRLIYPHLFKDTVPWRFLLNSRNQYSSWSSSLTFYFLPIFIAYVVNSDDISNYIPFHKSFTRVVQKMQILPVLLKLYKQICLEGCLG